MELEPFTSCRCWPVLKAGTESSVLPRTGVRQCAVVQGDWAGRTQQKARVISGAGSIPLAQLRDGCFPAAGNTGSVPLPISANAHSPCIQSCLQCTGTTAVRGLSPRNARTIPCRYADMLRPWCFAAAQLQSYSADLMTVPAAHVPLFLYPFLNTTSKTRPFEYLRLTSLGVIGALVKVWTLTLAAESSAAQGA